MTIVLLRDQHLTKPGSRRQREPLATRRGGKQFTRIRTVQERERRLHDDMSIWARPPASGGAFEQVTVLYWSLACEVGLADLKKQIILTASGSYH